MQWVEKSQESGRSWPRVRSIGLLLLFAAGGMGCAADNTKAGSAAEDEYVYENPIFPGTRIFSAAVQPSVDGMPRFSWNATGYRHVVAAVFDERINVKDGMITNSHRIRWIWHSGLETGREGNVLFEHGLADWDPAHPDQSTPAQRLTNGTYYWAVWTLDSQGQPARSTIEHTLNLPFAAEGGT